MIKKHIVGRLLLAGCSALLMFATVSCTSIKEQGPAREVIDEQFKEGVERFEERQEAVGKEPSPELQRALENQFGPDGAKVDGGLTVTETGLDKPVVFRGTGAFFKSPKNKIAATEVGDITLNFENTDIREVVKVILSDLMGENYILSPQVRGSVTMQTGKPLGRSLLLPTLETLLRMNGAALVNAGGIYRVLPVSEAVKGLATPQLGDGEKALPEGYGVLIVPLNHISVTEMQKILQPLAPDGSILRVDSQRNLLLLAGSGPELKSLTDTINLFDVDWLKGMSVGFYPLLHTSVDDVKKDIDAVFGSDAEGPLADIVQIVAVENANGVLVVSKRPQYLEDVRTWIERFDRLGGSGSEPRLYVYRVRNGEAVELSELLGNLYTKSDRKKTNSSQLAPGQEPAAIKSTRKPKTQPISKPSSAKAGTTSVDGGGELGGDVQIVADERNNALLIRATPSDFSKINAALKQLDVAPLQVLIEATIIEVQLVDDLKYGVQWFFKMGLGEYNTNAEWDGTLDSAKNSGLGKIFPGFNWQLLSGGNEVRAVFSAFAEEGLIKVLSSPSVMVLDNQTARIQVGDQVPIATSQQQSTSDSTAPVVNSIQYRDTGVVLEVKPRVNPGGLVSMEVSQEVSTAKSSDTSSLDSPTISTRKISSNVAVQNDQTVVLGGLIRDESSKSKGGLPILYKLPFVGPLFGQDVSDNLRTELVIILTPKVIAGPKDVKEVTENFRRRLKGLKGKF